MNCKTKSLMTKKKAFTLIELLIVIAIIGILFIVLVSKVDFATNKAKATGVQTDFRSFQLALETVSRENAGFNTFGWDTGDANQDGIRNSYDEGDINKNGVQDGTEVFTGHKVYDETFTKIYSLKKNGTGSYDRDALNRLETAINANLDPKLHIAIKDDGEIVMANGAQDPWNKEYHGYYITNADVDKKDRGAIVMYSDGANNEFGSEHTIANGVVSISIPGNNKYGKDDYAISTVYTYVNGYGEIKTTIDGFNNTASNNNSDLINDQSLQISIGSFTISQKYIPGRYETQQEIILTSVPIKSATNLTTGIIPVNDIWSYEQFLQRIRENEFVGDFIVYYVDIDNQMLHLAYADESLTKDEAIYSAAWHRYNQPYEAWNIAQWNGTNYDCIDYSVEISAINTFYTTEEKIVEKEVYVDEQYEIVVDFLPIDNITIDKNMTWNEWLVSEYNTDYTYDVVIRDSDYHVVDNNSIIDSRKSYVLRELQMFTLDNNDTFVFEQGMTWFEFANEKALYHPNRDFSYSIKDNFIMSSIFSAICNENNQINTKFIRESPCDIIQPIHYTHKGLNISVSK